MQFSEIHRLISEAIVLFFVELQSFTPAFCFINTAKAENVVICHLNSNISLLEAVSGFAT